MAICKKSTNMCLRQRDAEISERCREMEFSLYGREGDALMEGAAKFKYLSQTLDQMDYECTEIRKNFK